MKVKAIFAAALAATVMLASCSKEDNNVNNPGDADQMYVKISTPTVTRAIGSGSGDAALTLVGGKILFSGASGVISKVVTVVASGATGDQVNLADLETGALIQNINSNTAAVTFIGNHTNNPTITAGTTNISAVNNHAFTVAQIADGSNAVVSQVPIYGASTSLESTTVDSKATLKANFTVSAIGSRIQIAGIKGDAASVKSFDIAGIWINNFFPAVPYNKALVTTDVVNNGSDETKYVSPYAYPVLADATGTNLGGTKVSALEYSAGTNQYWAYNVVPNKGLAKSYLPHVIIKLTNLVDVNDGAHGTRYLTVVGYNDGTSITEMVGGNAYTFGGTAGPLTFTIDDVTPLPEQKTVQGQVVITAMDWEDNFVTPEF